MGDRRFFKNKFVAGGVLGHDGCVYFAPSNTLVDEEDPYEAANAPFLEVMRLNTKTMKISWIETRPDVLCPYAAPGVISPKGIIYFVPSSWHPDYVGFRGAACGIMRIDSNTQTVGYIDPEGGFLPGNDGSYVAGGVLGNNGCIYFAPWRSRYVLRINIDTDQVKFVGLILPSGYSWEATGVAADDGSIYFAPAVGQVLRIKPTGSQSEDIELIGPVFGNPKLRNNCQCFSGGGVLAPDGCIYFAPDWAQSILRIDPSDLSVRCLGSFTKAKHKYQSGGVLAKSGVIYVAPFNADAMLKIDVT